MDLWHKEVEIAGTRYHHWILAWHEICVASFYTSYDIPASRTASEFEFFAGGVIYPN